MPPDLGTPYPPSWSGRPPHMADQDLPLWTRAKPTFDADALTYYYDVAVGEGAGSPQHPDDPIAAGFFRLTRKRIDAVIETATAWHIIEVRPNAGLGALGAIQTYRSLWERDPPDTKPVRAFLVTDRLDTDVATTAVNANVTPLAV